MPPPEQAAASPAQDTGANSITAQLDMGGNAPAWKAYPAARCRCALPGFTGKAPAFETKPIVDFTGNAPCIEPKPRPDCTGTPQEKHSAAVLAPTGYHMQKKDNSGLTGTDSKNLRDLRKQQAQPASTILPPKFQARPYAATGITKKYISTKWQALPAITNR